MDTDDVMELIMTATPEEKDGQVGANKPATRVFDCERKLMCDSVARGQIFLNSFEFFRANKIRLIQSDSQYFAVHLIQARYSKPMVQMATHSGVIAILIAMLACAWFY